MTKHGVPMAFFEHALTLATDDCIDWPFADRRGYGVIHVRGRDEIGVHVLACERIHGARPDGADVRHSCGRGHLGCFNPRHLSWSTRAENMADKLVHDTHQRGERHGLHKLTEDQVTEIRRTYVGVGGPTQRAIAATYGICQAQVSDIVNGEKWGWLA